MALSTSAITTPNSVFRPPTLALVSKPNCSCLLSSSKPQLNRNDANNNLSLNSVSKPRNRIMDMGIGILAASTIALSPMDADATRIEYYATVGEPLCEFNFVRSGLGYCDVSQGSGVEVPYAELINVHYTARFGDGRVFDSSYKRQRPLTMRLGVGKVIKGLDQGILGGDGVPPMHVGGKRRLYVPPHLAYGPEPAGCFSGDCNIPGNATLVYDIKFVEVYSGNRKLPQADN
ncbi:Photosynthetic NDH subunit of lumenal location 4, chloroplastic [Linum perenne]